MEYRNYPLNAKPSPLDERDYPISMLVPLQQTFPESFAWTYLGEIKNQGAIGSCVAHSLAYTREIMEYNQTGVFQKFSIGFIYGNREYDLWRYEGEGMYPREALRNLRQCGDVLYDDFPQNEKYPIVKELVIQDKAALYEKAAPYKITTYCRMYNVDEVKTALMQLGPVSINCPIYDTFYHVSKGNPIVSIPDIAKEKLNGYHEMTILGWTKDGWIVINSWGDGWADKGYCYMPFNFPVLEYWSITDDIIVDAPNFIEMVRPGAIKAYREDKILPSLTIAQAILESAWGKSAPGYNLFGVKWTPGYDYIIKPTWEYINKEWVKVEAKFRKYNSYEESILDHSVLLCKPRYKAVREAKDYKTACTEIQKAGYATDPNYASKLINLIERYNLNQWDDDDMDLKEAVKILQDKGIVKTPAYWENNARLGNVVKGEYAEKLIIEAAKVLNK
jgi:hypothetical protein